VVVVGEMGKEGRSSGLEVVLVVGTLTLAWTFGNLVARCTMHTCSTMSGPAAAITRGCCSPHRSAGFLGFLLLRLRARHDLPGIGRADSSAGTSGARQMAHALLAFFFNIGVVALTVNLIASAI
jgi:hypothetical protein